MKKPSEMICEVCQEPLASGEEVVLSMKVHVGPGKPRMGLFRHKDPAACTPKAKSLRK